MADFLLVSEHEPEIPLDSDPQAHNPSLPAYNGFNVYVVVATFTSKLEGSPDSSREARCDHQIQAVGVYLELTRAREIAAAFVRRYAENEGVSADRPLEDVAEEFFDVSLGPSKQMVVIVTRSKLWERSN